MNKKAIKKVLAFVQMLKAPMKMLPYIMGLVIGFIRRFTEQDNAKLIDLSEQGFVCRKSSQIEGGCGSAGVTQAGKGSIAVAFACERIKDGALISSICLQKSKNPKQFSAAAKRFLFDTPLQLGNVTLTQVPQGLFLSWRTRSNAYLHIPSGFEKQELESYLEANKALICDKYIEGNFYAIVPEKGDTDIVPLPAPAVFSAGPCVLSGGETLWLGINNGKAEAYMAKDVCKGFKLVGTIPEIEPGRTVSRVCCAKLNNGRVLAVFCSAGELYSSFSDDMGTRWSVPKPLDIKGIEPNLVVNGDGVAALSFVDPSKSQPIRCSVNKDGESDWCEVRLLVSSTANKMHHPQTIALEKEFYTVSRQQFCGEKESSVLYTIWKPLKEDYDPALQAELKKSKRKKKKDAAK